MYKVLQLFVAIKVTENGKIEKYKDIFMQDMHSREWRKIQTYIILKALQLLPGIQLFGL